MFSYTTLIHALRQLKISSDLFSDQVQLTLALKMKHNFSKHLYRQQKEKVLQEENSFLLKSKKPSCIPCFFMGYVWNEYKQTYNQTASAKCLKSRGCHICKHLYNYCLLQFVRSAQQNDFSCLYCAVCFF